MKPLKPKYDKLSEEDFYLGFMLIVKERIPSLAEAISNDKTNEQTKQALDLALSFYDTSLQLAGELNKLKDENKKLIDGFFKQRKRGKK
ncbi:hypothetical protein UNSWCD_455 [Campylobacter concisus UNSWCD]|jgi:hypothetical protein|uniref:hypothetical protein n=1 Tax=Campylobacter concisus TaxID=199 RepID=UPI00025A66D3|nr:hypothetical protein [Campylobacter concisus]EIF07038.1 hypothetical protein UNSWCD_455 [Campylobacter concisus UNSWCD]